MIALIVFLLFLFCFQFLIIVSLYSENAVLKYRKGDISMNNIFSPKVYDWCKWIAIVCLPALSSFVVIISKIYGFDALGSQIAQTITAVATLLGALLGISHIQYKNGVDDNADS